jgi:hypothetical protein
MLLGGALAVGLSLTLAPRASADPPPWAGRWKHYEQPWEGQHWNRDYSNHNWDRSTYYRRNDPNYAKMRDRIQNDQAKIAEIEPTGRHRKALQWYEDDLQNARHYLHDEYHANR